MNSQHRSNVLQADASANLRPAPTHIPQGRGGSHSESVFYVKVNAFYVLRQNILDKHKARADTHSMAIRVNLDMVLVQRKMSLTELSQRIGISITNLSLLKTGKVKGMRFSTLEAICRELDCQPGDILEYVPDFV